jgi:hypothetical protein
MTRKVSRKRSEAPEPAEPTAQQPRVTRGETLIAMMRSQGGATALELATAVGWQVHSVRGFIAGTLKKREDLEVTATRIDGLTRYRVIDRAEGAA